MEQEYRQAIHELVDKIEVSNIVLKRIYNMLLAFYKQKPSNLNKTA